MAMTQQQKEAYRQAYMERKREDERIRSLIPSPSALPSAPMTNLVPAEMAMAQPTIQRSNLVPGEESPDPFQMELALANQAEQNRMKARNALNYKDLPTVAEFEQRNADPFNVMNPLPKKTDDLTAKLANPLTKGAIPEESIEPEVDFDKWLDPNYKMTDEEKKIARQKVKEYDDWYKSVPWTGSEEDKKKLIATGDITSPEYEEKRKMDLLRNKTSAAGSFLQGFVNMYENIANPIQDALTEALPGSEQDKEALRKMNEERKETMRLMNENSKTQNGFAYGGGKLANQAALYAGTAGATGAATEAIAGKLGANALGKFMIDQGVQFGQDIALDTLPTYLDLKNQGLSDEEIRKELGENMATNAAVNAGLGVFGEGFNWLKKNFGKNAVPGLEAAAKQTDLDKMQEYWKSQADGSYERQLLDELNASDRRIAEEALATQESKLPSDLLEQARAEQAMQRRIAQEAEAVKESRLTSDMLKQEAPRVEPELPKAGNELPKNELPAAEIGKELPVDARKLDLDDMKEIEKYAKNFEDQLPKQTTSEFNKAYEDYWNYIFDRGNNANIDGAAVEEALRRTAPQGADIDGFLKSVNEQMNTDGLKFSTDLEHTMKPLTEAEQKAIEGRTFRDLTEDEIEQIKDGFRYNKRYVRDMEKAAADSKNADLINAVEEVKAAHNAYYDAALNGDKNLIERYYKDFNNAVGRASRRFEKAGIKGFGQSKKLAGQFADAKSVIQGAQNTEGMSDDMIREMIEADEKTRYARPANEIPNVEPEKSVALESKGSDVVYGDMGTKKFSEIMKGEDLPKADSDIPKFSDTPKAEEVKPDIPAEEKIPGDYKERGYHESSRTKGDIPDDVKKALNEQESMNRNQYRVAHNSESQARADELWNNTRTWEEAEKNFNNLLRDRDTATAAYAKKLVSAYSENGQVESALRIMDAISEAGTKSGQFSQSLILGLAKDNPMTAMKYAERALDKINDAGRKKFGKKWQDFILNDEEKKLFENAKPGDEKAIKNAFDTVGERISREHPVKKMEQLKEATHIGMLFNMRTMVRNTGANLPTILMRAAGNRTEAVLQRVGHAFNKEIEVTQSLLGGGKKQRQLAKDIFAREDVKNLFNALGGKYDETSLNSFVKSKQMFKGNTPVDKLVDGLMGGFWRENGGLITKANEKLGSKRNNSLLELARNMTYKLLELGDAPFVKENFVARLASELKVKKITDINDVTDDMIQRAFIESLEATYKDPNKLSKLLLDIKKHTGLVGELAVPFSQTMGAIGARSFEYSPAGALKAIANLRKGTVNGNKEFVEKGIRDLSKALTGSGMILAGMGLYKAGIITGDYDSDPNVKEAQIRAGFKPYALHIGNKYFTFDWMQPSSIPLVMGTSITQALEDDSDKTGLAKVWDGVAKGTLAGVDSWFNQSALQSLAELLGGGNKKGYGKTSIAENFANALLEMPLRLIPSQAGAAARTVDRSYRDTFDPTSTANTLKNKFYAKIPGLSEKLPQSYDVWGQPRMRADSTGEAFFQQNLIPGEYGSDKSNEYDKQLTEIYNRYPEGKLFPDKVPYSLSIGEFSKKLTNEEHSELGRIQGGYNSELADSMLSNNDFKDMPDENKAEVANKVWNVARDLAYEEMFDKAPSSTNEKYVKEYKAHGAKGVIDMMEKEYAIKESGLTATEANKELYDKGGKEALKEKASYSEVLKGVGLTADTKYTDFMSEHPDSVDYIPALAEQGFTSMTNWAGYDQAKDAMPGLDAKTYVDTVKKIDEPGKDGTIDGKVSTDQMVAYLNAVAKTKEQGLQLAKAYYNGNGKGQFVYDGSTWKYEKKK